MKTKTLIFFLFSAVVHYVPSAATESLSLEDASTVVEKFQSFRHSDIFCSTTGRNSQLSPELVGSKVAQYLSNDFRLFYMWAACNDPQFPKSDYWLPYDFRFGNRASDGGIYNAITEGILVPKHIRVQKAKILNSEKAQVRVLFNWEEKTGLSTTYKLVKENGFWKIDDVAPNGYVTDMEEYLHASRSIKEEIKKAYRQAESEQTKKSQK